MYSWQRNNVHSITFKGTAGQARKMVETLERDFNEPKYGYNGELWDETDE